MNKIDMHFHSTSSDGKNTHEEILEQAKKKGLEFIALTDHDNISWDFQQKAEDFGIQSTQSLEISARNYEHEKSLHITCYANSFADDIFELLDGVKNARKNNLEIQVDVLQKHWFNISLWDLEHISQTMQRPIEALNKFDIARILYENPENKKRWIDLNNGQDIWLVEFYLQYFKRNWENFETFWIIVPEYEPSLDVCKTIQETNKAILSIAHPNVTFKDDMQGFLDNIEYYIKTAWINALEINSKATIEWIEIVKKTAEKHGLFITFWSDNHWIWDTDNKHSDFWELNPNISEKFIEKEFEKYRNFL